MSAIFALANQKGGVAKTTTTGILAAGLHKQGFSVLTIDCDPQGNLSMSMAADNQSGATMYEVMKGTVTAREAIQHTAACDIIPANTILAGIEQELHSVGKEMTLREKLRDEESGVANDYDYILIDCPPSLGLLTVNALTEQYVLQQMIAELGVEPYYYTTANSTGEIDFMLQAPGSVIPVEVKAEENLRAKSLRAFCEKYHPKHAVRTSMSDFREQDWMTNIPLYNIDRIGEYLK